MIADSEEKNFQQKNLLFLLIDKAPNVILRHAFPTNCIDRRLVHQADPITRSTGFQNLPVLLNFPCIPFFQENPFSLPVFFLCNYLPFPSYSYNRHHGFRPSPASWQEQKFLF